MPLALNPAEWYGDRMGRKGGQRGVCGQWRGASGQEGGRRSRWLYQNTTSVIHHVIEYGGWGGRERR